MNRKPLQIKDTEPAADVGLLTCSTDELSEICQTSSGNVGGGMFTAIGEPAGSFLFMGIAMVISKARSVV